MPGIFEYDFMARALIGAALVGSLAPAFGVFMVLRRLSLISDTLSHVAFAGVAVGVLLRVHPPAVALATTTLAAASIEELRARRMLPGDAALAVFLYGALAIALIVLSLADGFNASLFGYLFGSVLTVAAGDLWLVGGIMVVATCFFTWFYSDLAQAAFDPDLARINGVRVRLVNIGLAVLTAATITVSMRIVGVLLIGALLVVPALIALRLATGLAQTVVLASAVGVAVAVGGTVISYYADVAPGGAVVLLGVATLVAVEAGYWLWRRTHAVAVSADIHRHHARPAEETAAGQLELPSTEGLSGRSVSPTPPVERPAGTVAGVDRRPR